ncbi:MAG TPA: hypothetical protein VGN10_03355 [Pyrinomonadaceae bacterium]
MLWLVCAGRIQIMAANGDVHASGVFSVERVEKRRISRQIPSRSR